MRFWKKRLQRVAAMVCSVALVASMMPTAVFATASETTTPTTEPASIVETTPELSESPENTDATVTTSAPDTGTGSTSAPEATPAGNTDDTKEPEESPEPSEEPTDDTTESGEEGTETTDSTTAPSEENVEQQVSVPQTLAAAPAAAPETRESKVIYSDADAGINVQLGDKPAGIPQKVTFVVSVDGVQKAPVTLDSVPLVAAPLKVDADNWNCNVYGDGVSVTPAPAVGGYNLTFDSSKKEYTVHIDFKSPTGQLTMKNADGSIDLGTVTYKTGWDQNTTIRVYLNYELVQTFEDVYISASNEVADYNNFQVKTNGDYYLKGVKLVDSSIWGQTVGYTESNQHLFFGLPYQSGENTIALYFFDYKNGVNVDFSRLINDMSLATSELDKACDTLNLSFTYNGRNISYDYNDWGRLYLPKGVDITVTPTIKSGYYFEYWRTSDAAATQNALYSVLPDASWQLEGEGTPFEGLLALTEKMRMHFEDSDYPDMNIHLYMTDGTRHVVHKKITYNSNYPLDAGMADISEQQYFYSPSDGLRHGTRILGEMPAPTGYRFLYWTTGKDGSGTKYMPGDLYGTDGSGDMTLYAQWEKIETPPEDDEPDAPDGKTLRDLGLGVRVQCTTNPDEHGNVVSTIRNTSVKFGDVVEKDGHYECVATISAAEYIEDFNDPTYGTPGHTGKDTEVQVVLTSDGKGHDWELAADQDEIIDKLEKPTAGGLVNQVVTFEVTCEEETTDIPDVDVTELGAIIAVDCTTAAEDHPTWMSTILGTLEKDYIIEYSSNRTTATIKIASTDLYLDEYCQLKGYHALDETKASDLSFKLKYENDAWVLDSDDNTATIYVSCPDVTVEKTITSVERDGKTLEPTPEMLKVGDKINYQIVITNNSNITLNDLTVTDTFTGANAPDAVSGSTKTWDKTADGWTWSDTLTLNVNGKKTFTYTYTVAEGDKGNTIRNSAAVAGKGLDDDEETDDETTPEVENPAVGVEKSLVQVKRGEEIFLAYKGTIPEQLEVGDELTYEIEVKNIGNVKLNGLTLTDTFNGHFAPSKVKDKVDNVELTNEWEKDTTTGPWTLKIENISPDVGEIETYTYTYIVNQADAGNKLTNTAAVSGDDTDPDDEDTDEHPVKDDGDITLQPADITIYMGGKDGYEGAAGGESNSLPEPGFYITLPDKVKTALQDADYPNGEAADLSDFITGVTATTEDGQTRHWDMEKYGADDSTAWIDDTKQAHFVYRIVPEQGQPAISVNFTDSKNNPVKEDKFTLTDSLSETYFMSLNTAGVDVETISLTFNINGEIFHCGYDAKNSQEGTLTVRYASEEHDTTKAVTSENNLNPDTFGVVVGSDQLFNINQEDEGADGVDVTHEDVSLLADNIVSGNANEYVEALTEKAQEEDDFASSSVVQAMYLDLVDAENGNAWLTTKDNAEVTVFWPYPEGISEESDIQLIHFKGLDRDMATNEVLDEIEETVAINVPITKGEYGFTFNTSSFSPFVLVQDTTRPSGGGDEPSGGDDGNNDNNNNNNNNNTNNQTTTVNVANQAAAPAAAPAAVSVPQTSDDMPIGALTAAAVAAAAALVGLLVVRKRRQK